MILPLALVVGWALWMVFAPRIRLDLTANRNDPASMDLVASDFFHKSFKRLENGVEAGLVQLDEGGPVRYWFISRHVQAGSGLTRFDFPDGDCLYMSGAYCCEVVISDKGSSSEAALRSFIKEMDGTKW
jgi:hypothetical protein